MKPRCESDFHFLCDEALPDPQKATEANSVIMDKLRPQESKSLSFRAAVLELIDSPLPVHCILQKTDSLFLAEIAAHPSVTAETVTFENRNKLRKQWLSKISRFCMKKRS